LRSLLQNFSNPIAPICLCRTASKSVSWRPRSRNSRAKRRSSAVS